jgi:hypothetical protein
MCYAPTIPGLAIFADAADYWNGRPAGVSRASSLPPLFALSRPALGSASSWIMGGFFAYDVKQLLPQTVHGSA